MSSMKKAPKIQRRLLRISMLLIFLNSIVSQLYLDRVFTLTVYKYIFISFNAAILFSAVILKKKFDDIYLALTLIMVTVLNLSASLMIVYVRSIVIIFASGGVEFLALILIYAFISKVGDE